MISNQVLQNTLEGLKEISRTEFCVIDTEGKVLASTFADFSIAAVQYLSDKAYPCFSPPGFVFGFFFYFFCCFFY